MFISFFQDLANASKGRLFSWIVHGMDGYPDTGHATHPAVAREPRECADFLFVIGQEEASLFSRCTLLC